MVLEFILLLFVETRNTKGNYINGSIIGETKEAHHDESKYGGDSIVPTYE
jgi:hypothetical protein